MRLTTPLVAWPEKVPATLAAVPPGLKTRPDPVVTVNVSPVNTGADEKVPVTCFAVPPFVIVRALAPFVMVIVPADGCAVNVPVLEAAVAALAVSVVPATLTVPVAFAALKVPVLLAATAAAPVAFSAKTTKSAVQLGAWLMSKLYFAGNILGATCELLLGPSE